MKKFMPIFLVLLFFLFLSAETNLFSVKIWKITQNFSSAELSLVFLCISAIFFIKKNALLNFWSDYKILLLLSVTFLISGFLSSVYSPVDKIYALKNFFRYFLIITVSWLFIYLSFIYDNVKFLSIFLFIAILSSLISFWELANPTFAKFLADKFREGQSVYINGKLRPAATLVHSNIFGCFMGISIIIALKFYFESKLGKIYFFLVIILFLISLSLSSSRNALFTFLISLSLLFLNKKYIKTILIVLTLFLLTYLIFSPSFNRISKINTESSVARLHLWRGAIKMFKNYPLLGVGPGCFNKSISKYASENLLHLENQFINKGALNAHNGFFNILAEFGLIGIIIIIIFFIYYLKIFIQLYPLSEITANHSLLLVVALPFLADAFFYSYFYMVIFCIIIFSLVQKNKNYSIYSLKQVK